MIVNITAVIAVASAIVIAVIITYIVSMRNDKKKYNDENSPKYRIIKVTNGEDDRPYYYAKYRIGSSWFDIKDPFTDTTKIFFDQELAEEEIDRHIRLDERINAIDKSTKETVVLEK